MADVSRSLRIVLACTAASAAVWAQPPVPVGVSPGADRELVQIEQRCPTFSWGGTVEADRFELVVYRLEESQEMVASKSEIGSRPALAVQLPGTARAWTPALGQCLEPGRRYAWVARAAGAEGVSDWSEPRLFSVAAGPTVAEVEQALAVLSAFMASAGSPAIALEDREEDSSFAPERGSLPPLSAAEGGTVPSLGGLAAVRALQAAAAGDASGLIAQTASADGAGAVLGNSAGGPDLFLDGTADGQTGAALTQSGVDRASPGAETFNLTNSGTGAMTLQVDGVEVVTTLTDQNTLYTAGNQLSLVGTTFNVLEGSSSDLDADLLDGLDSTAFTPAGTDLWVDEAGDTMTGPLVLSNTTVDLSGTSSVQKDGLLFLHQPETASLGVGRNTLISNTTGIRNVASGASALRYNTEGSFNTASGVLALGFNTTGSGNTATGHRALYGQVGVSTGSDNTASGSRALRANTTGNGNTASGSYALFSNETGNANTASGYQALRANTASFNTASGYQALAANTTGSGNTAAGILALYSNTTGGANTAMGGNALYSNTMGINNTAAGFGALRYNTTGYRNTALGVYAGRYATTGSDNIFLGSGAVGVAGEGNTIRIGGNNQQNRAFIEGISGVTPAGAADVVVIDGSGQLGSTPGGAGSGLDADTLDTLDSTAFMPAGTDLWVNEGGDTMTGDLSLGGNDLNDLGVVRRAGQLFLHEPPGTGGNTGVGLGALTSITTARDNTAAGNQALSSTTTGNANTATGTRALYANTGNYNTASGRAALSSNTTGSKNTGLGYRALYRNDTGSQNTAVGAEALFSNTSASNLTATGYQALFSNTTGSGNTATGFRALRDNIGGMFNTATGNRALYSNTYGTYNTAHGYFALIGNTTGSRNTATGYRALAGNTIGAGGTAIGYQALFSNIDGFGNTAVGYLSLERSTGHRNTALGHRAGSYATTGSDNIFLGSGATGVAGEGNTIRIGGTTVGAGDGQQNRTFINGIRGVTTEVMDAIPVLIDSAGQLGTVSSARRFKREIQDMGEASSGLLELRPVTFKYKQEPNEGIQPLQFGLIAEEVAEVLPDLVVYDRQGRPETVRYHLLSSLLLNELQRQQRELDEKTKELDSLRSQDAQRTAELEKQHSELVRQRQLLADQWRVVRALQAKLGDGGDAGTAPEVVGEIHPAIESRGSPGSTSMRSPETSRAGSP